MSDVWEKNLKTLYCAYVYGNLSCTTETMSFIFLFLVLEVMQFARDAHQAEGWLMTQEPYLRKEEEKKAVS